MGKWRRAKGELKLGGLVTGELGVIGIWEGAVAGVQLGEGRFRSGWHLAWCDSSMGAISPSPLPPGFHPTVWSPGVLLSYRTA